MSGDWKSNVFVLVGLGVVAGLVAGGIVGALAISVLDGTNTVEALPPVPDYDLEILVEEAFINRIMLEEGGGDGEGVSLVGGQVDLIADGRADFAVKLGLGPFEPVIEGQAAFRTSGDGGLAIELVEVKLGKLALTNLIPQSIVDQMGDLVNDELVGRVASKGLEVVAVSSGDTTLSLYLASTP
ncbi:MAG: hypothetical protein JXB35_09980 [Anaerolineae bacterium]|nr:hypothetical protein [Anaerolineae bacterium]